MATSSTFTATDGSAYELQMGRWSRRLAEPFLDFAGTSDGERVLDVGSGTGSLTFALAQQTPVRSLCGLDFSPAYVDYAARRNRDPRIEFRVGDACAMPFPDATFDRVMSLLMLHFVPDAHRAVAEMRRVARPGAVVAAAVWDVRGGFVANRIFFDTAAAIDPKANEVRARNYTRPMTRPGELLEVWQTVGFEDVEETLLSIRMEFASFDDYWAPYLGKQGPAADYLASLDDGSQAKLREHVQRAYLDGEPDGPRTFVASAWAVRGIVPS